MNVTDLRMNAAMDGSSSANISADPRSPGVEVAPKSGAEGDMPGNETADCGSGRRFAAATRTVPLSSRPFFVIRTTIMPPEQASDWNSARAPDGPMSITAMSPPIGRFSAAAAADGVCAAMAADGASAAHFPSGVKYA